jgi:hypothetical protein
VILGGGGLVEQYAVVAFDGDYTRTLRQDDSALERRHLQDRPSHLGSLHSHLDDQKYADETKEQHVLVYPFGSHKHNPNAIQMTLAPSHVPGPAHKDPTAAQQHQRHPKQPP